MNMLSLNKRMILPNFLVFLLPFTSMAEGTDVAGLKNWVYKMNATTNTCQDEAGKKGLNQAFDKARFLEVYYENLGSVSCGEFSNLDLTASPFENSDFRGSKFLNSSLVGVSFGQADLSYADLAGSDMRGVDLWRAIIKNANLSRANLGPMGEFGPAKLQESILAGSNFSNADLNRADLLGADLRNASLFFADLRGAQLRNTNLEGTNMRFADLRGLKVPNPKTGKIDTEYTDLSGSNVLDAVLDGARFNEYTILPFGSNSTFEVQREMAESYGMRYTP